MAVRPHDPDANKRRIWEYRQAHPGATQSAAAAALDLHVRTVINWWKWQPETESRSHPGPGRVGPGSAARPVSGPSLPEPAPEAGGPDLPTPFVEDLSPYEVDAAGRWLVIGDCHIPYHDVQAIRQAVGDAESKGVCGVLINGDLLDCYQISRFYKEPDKPRFVDEIKKTRQFLEWLRSRFPKARILFKEGNHDARVRHYVAERTPELWGLEGYDLSGMLGLSNYGVEHIEDKRPVHLGRLPVFHGHELGPGGGVNPARWLFLKIVCTGMVNHFHRSSHHDEPSYDGRLHGTWSVGCTAHLKPAYARVNKWQHGWAIVDTPVNSAGTFHVDNRRILRDGRVV